MLNLLHVEVGAVLLRTDGSTVVVEENPGDGQWLVVRSPDAEPGSGELCHAQDLVEHVDAG